LHDSVDHEDRWTEDLLKLVDWPILVLFMGLFVVTGTLQATGYADHAVLALITWVLCMA